ncbi:MAG: hypothetical protein GOP50_04520 [Candidatus Heimdallarchaeota archaeon]|nr:hypothetical protein [Candidatus Heimdallarchaeota archaeon]
MSGALAVGAIFLFRYVESITSVLPAFVWGIIFIALCFSFAIFYMIGYKVYEKRSIHDSSQAN